MADVPGVGGRGFANIAAPENARWLSALAAYEAAHSPRSRKATPHTAAQGHQRQQQSSNLAVSVAEALVAAAVAARAGGAASSLLIAEPPRVVDGGDVRNFVVLQGEMGCLTTCRAGASPQASARPPTDTILSPDATSCVILGLRVVAAQQQQQQQLREGEEKSDAAEAAAAAVAHFGSGGPEVAATMRAMLHKLCLPALLLRRHGEGERLRAEWFVAGGVINFKYTLQILLDIACGWRDLFTEGARDTQGQQYAVDHVLRGDASCFWSENTVLPSGSACGSGGAATAMAASPEHQQRYDATTLAAAQCRVRGLAIHVPSGAAFACELGVGTRMYPFAHLRGLRFAGRPVPLPSRGSHPDAAPLPCVSVVPYMIAEAAQQGRYSRVRDIVAEEGGAAVAVVVEPFVWDALPRHIVRAPDAEMLRWSTTPNMEPPDFASCIRAAAVYSNAYAPSDVFARPTSPSAEEAAAAGARTDAWCAVVAVASPAGGGGDGDKWAWRTIQ